MGCSLANPSPALMSKPLQSRPLPHWMRASSGCALTALRLRKEVPAWHGGSGAGPHRSGDIAASLARKVSTLAPLRSALIEKGMIYSPNHGDTAFTVPLFDEFMRRIMPGDDWRMG